MQESILQQNPPPYVSENSYKGETLRVPFLEFFFSHGSRHSKSEYLQIRKPKNVKNACYSKSILSCHQKKHIIETYECKKYMKTFYHEPAVTEHQ